MGAFDVLATPGYAAHHLTYLHRPSGTAFAGDAAGVRIAPSALVLAPTVPPEFDPVAWRSSIEALAARRPGQLALAHFGLSTDVAAHLSRAIESVAHLAAMGRALGESDFTAAIEASIEALDDPSAAQAYRHATQPQILWSGAARYWRKQ
jgi:glyoxylase-like metal-dependent hydrolase (beta-lactamase superfamily II)